MEYSIKSAPIRTVIGETKIEANISGGSISTTIGEGARMNVSQATVNVESGKAEIEKAVNQGKTVISGHTTEKIGEFDSNAVDKTQDFNDNYVDKKALIDAEVSTAQNAAAEAKQWAIGDPTEPTGNSAKYWAEEAATTLANKQDKLTVGTGIDITSNVISVTSPALINTATYPTDSIALITTSTNSAHNAVAVGYNSIARDYGGVAIGTHAKSYNNGASVGGTAEATGSKTVAIGYGAKAESSYSIQIGQGTNTEANSLYVATSSSDNYKLLGSDGLIPDARINSSTYTTKTYVDNADNNLQSQIDALVVASDVFDVVGTYAELQAYDISTVPVNDIIKVLVDSTHSNAATYYRCVETGGVKSWSYIGSEGAYYTKAEADNLFPTKTITGASLDYTGTTLSLLNPSGTSLSSVTIKSTPDLDGVTIDTNSDDELEAIGTVNKNTAVGATAVKYDWIGTLAEYNSQNVETLHPEWVCYITDDVSGGTSVYTKAEVDSAISTALTTMLDSAFPVGSRYITEASTCPLATLIPNSTWVLTSQGRVLQGADSNHASGTTAGAGLPNITGQLGYLKQATISNYNNPINIKTGAFSSSFETTASPAQKCVTPSTTDADRSGVVDFSASNSNSIYGNSTTVQPPAEFVNIFKRTA